MSYNGAVGFREFGLSPLFLFDFMNLIYSIPPFADYELGQVIMRIEDAKLREKLLTALRIIKSHWYCTTGKPPAFTDAMKAIDDFRMKHPI